jgi:hypothetical protein
MKNSKMLAVIIALQGLLLAGQWLGNPGYLTSASAQISDPGRDRQQTLDAIRETNAKLDKVIAILGSGDLQVKLVKPDEK